MISLDLPEAFEMYRMHAFGGGLHSAELAGFLRASLPEWLSRLDDLSQKRLGEGSTIPAYEYVMRRERVLALKEIVRDRMRNVDVLALPTVPVTPAKLVNLDDVETRAHLNRMIFRNTCIANLMVMCAISIPCGFCAAGMPVGFQMLAPHGDDEKLLRAALAAEGVWGTPRDRLGDPFVRWSVPQ